LEVVGGSTYNRNAAEKFAKAKRFNFVALGDRHEASKP
jgi:hypothetical protein